VIQNQQTSENKITWKRKSQPPKARSTAEHSRDNKLTNMEQRTKHKNQDTQGASPEQVRAKINCPTMQI
jgi:hypothetical protein